MRIELSPVVVLPEDSTDMDVMVSGDSIAVWVSCTTSRSYRRGDICPPLPSMRGLFPGGLPGQAERYA